jgi:hypothetical protein
MTHIIWYPEGGLETGKGHEVKIKETSIKYGL